MRGTKKTRHSEPATSPMGPRPAMPMAMSGRWSMPRRLLPARQTLMAPIESDASEASEGSRVSWRATSRLTNFGAGRASNLDWDTSMESCMHFRGLEQQTLLRASFLSTVMRRSATIFADSKGSAATYELSHPVHHIDAFISHNWSVPRLDKFLCLALIFNQLYAWVAVLTFQIVVGVCYYLGILGPQGATTCLLFVASPIFVVVMLFAREPCAQLGYRGIHVFLDKTCIHQEDKQLQTEGIRKLGAFLNDSRTMVVLYTDVYLQKLWTVYEVASYISLRGVDGMTLMPTFVPKVLLVCHAMGFVSNICNVMWIGEHPFTIFIAVILGFIVTICLMFVLRWYARYLSKAQERVMVFDVERCTCFCEEDRPLVYHNIANLMRTIGTVDHEAPMDEALAAFSEGVRELLPNAFRRSLGNLGISYSLVFSCTFFFSTMPQLLNVAREDAELPDLISQGLLTLVFTLTVMPLKLGVLVQVCASCLELHGIREFLLLVVFVAIFDLMDVVLPCVRINECSLGPQSVLIACVWVLATALLYSSSKLADRCRSFLWSLLGACMTLCECLCLRSVPEARVELRVSEATLAVAAATAAAAAEQVVREEAEPGAAKATLTAACRGYSGWPAHR